MTAQPTEPREQHQANQFPGGVPAIEHIAEQNAQRRQHGNAKDRQHQNTRKRQAAVAY